MPQFKTKSFSIPVSNAPVTMDVILIAISSGFIYLAQLLDSGWTLQSGDGISFASTPVYANGTVTFDVSYISSSLPAKACFVPGPNH